MIVDGSDRKFYLMAASQSVEGEKALRDFDAALAKATTSIPSTPSGPPKPVVYSGTGSGSGGPTVDSVNLSSSSPTWYPPEFGIPTQDTTPPKNDVTDYQQQLINRGYNLGSSGADGVAGKMTNTAIMKFQRENGLTVDGIVGPQTLAALNGKTANEATAAVQDASTAFEKADVQNTYVYADIAMLNGYDVSDTIDEAEQDYKAAQDNLHDASVVQYEAFENQTGNPRAYVRADDAASLPENAVIDGVRQNALEEVVTSEITTPQQANARMTYATQQLDQSTTALAQSSLSELPPEFDLSVLGRAGDVMADELEQLEGDQEKDHQVYLTIAGNNYVYRAGLNEDITVDIYEQSHLENVVRALQLDVGEATLNEIVNVSGEALVAARLAPAQNDNEKNSQLTATIKDIAYLNMHRNQALIDGLQTDATEFDPAAVNIDLLLDWHVDGIAEDLTDRNLTTRRAFEDYINSLGLSHEFDVVGIDGVITQAAGSSLATGASDADVRRAVMLREFPNLVEAVLAYHNGREHSDNALAQGNYLYNRTIATDLRSEELAAQAKSGAFNEVPFGSDFTELAVLNHNRANEIADRKIKNWSLLLPEFEVPAEDLEGYAGDDIIDFPSGQIETATRTQGVILNGAYYEVSARQFQDLANRFDYTAPDFQTNRGAMTIVNQFHTREVTRANEKIADLQAELARTPAPPPFFADTLWPIDRSAEIQSEIERLEQEGKRHQTAVELTSDNANVIIADENLRRLLWDASAAADMDGPNSGPLLVQDRPNGTDIVHLDSPILDDNGDVLQYAVVRNAEGEVFNPISGLAPSVADFDHGQFGPAMGGNSDWHFSDGVWRYVSDDPIAFAQDFTPWAGDDLGAHFNVSEVEISQGANGGIVMSYVVNGVYERNHRVSGQIGGVDARLWNQVFATAEARNAQQKSFAELSMAPIEATQPWRDRIFTVPSQGLATVGKNEGPLLEATQSLDQAEDIYLANDSDVNRQSLRDARYAWKEAYATFLHEEAQDAVTSAEVAAMFAPPDQQRLAGQRLDEAQEQLNAAAEFMTSATTDFNLRNDDSEAARLRRFAVDSETVGTYSQSFFNTAAAETASLHVKGEDDAQDVVARHFFGDVADRNLTSDQSDFVNKISDEITDITGDGGGQVETVPIMYEQEIDGQNRLITDVIFRVTAEDGQSRLVTVDGRSYKDETDFRNNNRIVQAKGETLLIMPEEGQITYNDEGHVNLSIGDGRVESGFETFRRVTKMDLVVGGIGVGAGILLMATGTGAPLGLMLVAGGATAYGVGTAALDIHDRFSHGEDWNSGGNLMNYGTIGASLLPGGSMVRAARVGRQYKAAVTAARETTEATGGFRNAVTAFTGRNFTGNPNSEFAQLVRNARFDDYSAVAGQGLASKLLVTVPGRAGGVLGTGMTAIDTVTLAQQINEYGWSDTGKLEIGMTLADIGSELVGAVSGLRFAGSVRPEGVSAMGDGDFISRHQPPIDQPEQNPIAVTDLGPSSGRGYDVFNEDFESAGRQRLMLSWNEDGSHQLIDLDEPEAPSPASGGSGADGPDRRVPTAEGADDPDGQDNQAGDDGRVSQNTQSPKEVILDVLKKGVSTFRKDGDNPNQVMTILDDGSRVLIRRDFGDFNHGDGDHYNLQIHDSKGRTVENFHFMVNDDGTLANVLDKSGAPIPQFEPGNWRSQMGAPNFDPVDLFVSDAHKGEANSLTRWITMHALSHGMINEVSARAMLRDLTDNLRSKETGDALSYLSEFSPDRYDALIEHLLKTIETRRDSADNQWFDTPPAQIDPDLWAGLGQTDKAAYTFISETEAAIEAEFITTRTLLINEIDRYIKLSATNRPWSKGQKINAVYEGFRLRNDGDVLPPAVAEYLTTVKELIQSDQMTTQQLDYIRDVTPLLIGIRAQAGGARLNPAIAGGVVVAAATQVPADGVAEVLEATAKYTRDGSDLASRLNTWMKSHKNSVTKLSHGVAAGAKGIDAAESFATGDNVDGGVLLSRAGLDVVRVWTLGLEDLVSRTHTEAVHPLLNLIEEVEKELPYLPAHSTRAEMLQDQRKLLYSELEANASAIRIAQKNIARYTPIADTAGFFRAEKLWDTISALGLTEQYFAPASIGISALTATYGFGLAKSISRSISTIYGTNPKYRDLTAEIRDAGTFDEILKLIPRNADLRDNAIKWDGTEAADLRTWIIGDANNAHSIVKVFMSQKAPSTDWEIETHVIDLRNQTYDVHLQTAPLRDPTKNPRRTRKDPNFFWNESKLNSISQTIQHGAVSIDILKSVMGPTR